MVIKSSAHYQREYRKRLREQGLVKEGDLDTSRAASQSARNGKRAAQTAYVAHLEIFQLDTAGAESREVAYWSAFWRVEHNRDGSQWQGQHRTD